MKIQSLKKFLIVTIVSAAALSAVQAVHAAEKIIVNVTEARVRETPTTNGKILGKTQLGTVYQVIGKKALWYNIAFREGKNGWISASIVEPFNPSNKGVVYAKLADKYLTRQKLNFTDAAELVSFLNSVQSEVYGTENEVKIALKRLSALKAATDLIPFDKVDTGIYKTFTDENAEDIVYSEPAGQYFVAADRYWELRDRFSNHPLADEIAWRGAETPLPGECEGYVVCHLYSLRQSDLKYLEYFPNGKFTGEALKNLSGSLSFMAEAASGGSPTGYYLPDDAEDRASFKRLIAEMRGILSKIKGSAAAGLINDLKKIENGKFDQTSE